MRLPHAAAEFLHHLAFNAPATWLLNEFSCSNKVHLHPKLLINVVDTRVAPTTCFCKVFALLGLQCSCHFATLPRCILHQKQLLGLQWLKLELRLPHAAAEFLHHLAFNALGHFATQPRCILHCKQLLGVQRLKLNLQGSPVICCNFFKPSLT